MENWDAIAAILSFLLSRNRIRRFIISNVLSRIDIWRIRAGVSLMKHREREFYDRGRSQVESRYVGRGQSNNGLPGKIITARRISSFWNIFVRKKKNNNNNNNNLSFTNFLFYFRSYVIMRGANRWKNIYYLIRIDNISFNFDNLTEHTVFVSRWIF